jgi:hypothetical protein
MCYGITKIYYRTTIGHVFTKPVQIERTTQSPPSKLFFIVVHISAASSGEYRCIHVDVCVWQEHEYRIDVCRVTRGAHIEHL